MTIAAEPGLRERKRVATKRAIELAAITLVAEKGLDRLTVDEIVHEADVSARTFFNYFPSKEAALIGAGPALPAEDSLRAFIAGSSGDGILAGLRDLLTEASELAADDLEVSHIRRKVLKHYPALFAMRMATMREFEDQLCGVVTQRLAADEPELSHDQDALTRRARLVTLVAFAAMKHAWVCWADDPKSTDLQTRLRASFDQLDGLFASNAFH
jgi:AcrR family transcriptional regulator